jgi:phosphohistidine phosphatase
MLFAMARNSNLISTGCGFDTTNGRMPCLNSLMKTLFLMRHAKSSWDDATLADIERPLNERGKRSAPFMGALMRRLDMIPACIISSPADRACTTAKLAHDAGAFDAAVQIDERVYEASANTLRQVISEVDDSCQTAMIVGHNPGMEGLIRYLTGQIEPMPTGAVAWVELDVDRWTKTDEGVGTVRKVLRPKHEMETRP